MKLPVHHRFPLVIGATLLLTGGTGAAAYSLAGQTSVSPTDSGNTLPIDDNHPSAAATRTPEPGDDRGVATTADDHGVNATPEASHAAETGDDHGVDATPEPGEDHHSGGTSSGSGTDDATPEPSHDSGSGDSGSGSGGSGGSGGGSNDSTATPSASPDDHGGSSGSGGSGGGSDGSSHS